VSMHMWVWFFWRASRNHSGSTGFALLGVSTVGLYHHQILLTDIQATFTPQWLTLD
jgi:hypothetical protein